MGLELTQTLALTSACLSPECSGSARLLWPLRSWMGHWLGGLQGQTLSPSPSMHGGSMLGENRQEAAW